MTAKVIEGPWKKRKNEETKKMHEDLLYAEELTEDLMVQMIHTLNENGFAVSSNDFLHDMGFIIECVKSLIYRELGIEHPLNHIMTELTTATVEEERFSTTLDFSKVKMTSDFVSDLSEEDDPEIS